MQINNLSYILLIALAAPGCIIGKNMASDGESDADSGSAEAGTATSGGNAGSDSNGNDDGNSTTTGPDDDGNITASTGVNPTATASTAADATASTGVEITATSFGEDDGEDTAADDQTLCENSEGTWDPAACGSYECGLPIECEAVIPGCDCGYLMNWEPGLGCVPDDACLDATFDCNDLQCSVGLEYCYVVYPGPGGPEEYSCEQIPDECLSDHTCECVDPMGDIDECMLGSDGGLTVLFYAP